MKCPNCHEEDKVIALKKTQNGYFFHLYRCERCQQEWLKPPTAEDKIDWECIE